MAHFECGMNLEKIFQFFPLLWGISGAAATMFQEGFISHPLQITKLFLVQSTSGPFESETILFEALSMSHLSSFTINHFAYKTLRQSYNPTKFLFYVIIRFVNL